MKITLFSNRTGIVHGNDPRHISCDVPGVIKIGRHEVAISNDSPDLFPLLFNGETIEHPATYITDDGVVYELSALSIRGGLIAPPNKLMLEIMDLRCQLEEANADRADMREQINVLKGIFDTNSLNFLIK